jgi:hypothetical protein
MLKQLFAAAATVALLSAGAAWAQTSGNAAVGTTGGATAGAGGSSVGTNDTTHGKVTVKKNRAGAETGSSGSAGTGSATGMGAGANTGSSTSLGVKPGGASGNTDTSTGMKIK